ncbi:MAG: hydroxyacylglutathione hydrolase [Gammaproteobacteria bacterium]|nr:hydroxyacylglutathione hydrolase [Gammaproteobacteria bacterium]
MTSIFPILAFRDNYIWCLQKDFYCAVVDPGDATPVIKLLQEKHLTLSAILLTHHHYDHTDGVKGLLDYANVPVYGPHAIAQVTRPIVLDGQFDIDEIGLNFTTFGLPGHTLEHVGYYDAGMVFTGDTLFTAGCGRIFEGSIEQMYQSLIKLKSLPETTLVYCGHEYTENNLRFALLVEPDNEEIKQRYNETLLLRKNNTPTVPASIAIEKKTNPFLRCDQKNVITAAEKYAGSPLTHPVEVLKALRDWKNHS